MCLLGLKALNELLEKKYLRKPEISLERISVYNATESHTLSAMLLYQYRHKYVTEKIMTSY